MSDNNKTTTETREDLRKEINALIGEINAISWYTATQASDLKDTFVTTDELNKVSEKFMQLIAREKQALLESCIKEIGKIPAKVTQEITPNGISQLIEPMNNLTYSVSDWEEKFDEEFVITNPRNIEDEGWLTGALPPEVKHFITELLAREKQELLEDLLKNGHGGGNFRRLITMKLAEGKEL